MKHLTFLLAFSPLFALAQFEGNWYSSFTVMGNAMRMQLDVSESPTKVILINPDQEMSVTCDEAFIIEDSLTFRWKARGLFFEGALENGTIIGTMSQSGFTWEVKFTRELQEKRVVARWQTPEAPFLYSSDSIIIKSGGVQLGATLLLPKGFDSSTPIVILASGSGPQNRDCELAGHKPFWVIADHLARNGIASLRFDDRGTGKSTGDYNKATLMDLASDVESCARYLRKKRKFKKNPLGAIGHSEGGMHVLIAAKEYKEIDYLVQLATVGLSGKYVLVKQQYDIPKAAGQPEAVCQWNQAVYQHMASIISAYPKNIASDSLQAYLGRAYDNAPESFDKSLSNRASFIISNISFMNNVWMRQFIAFDASDYLKDLDIPILALHAEKDIQVSASENSASFEAYPNATTQVLPGLNHLFQPCSKCTIEEYGEIETTFSPEALTILTDWIQNLHLD